MSDALTHHDPSSQSPSAQIEPALLTVKELAGYLHISRTTLLGLLACGAIGPRPIRLAGCRCLRFSRREIDQWIAAGAPPRARCDAVADRRRR
jgi:excisionase family DNA binding protein